CHAACNIRKAWQLRGDPVHESICGSFYCPLGNCYPAERAESRLAALPPFSDRCSDSSLQRGGTARQSMSRISVFACNAGRVALNPQDETSPIRAHRLILPDMTVIVRLRQGPADF